MDRMLTGVRILDLTQAYSGPFCCMNLADHGAEVIKIEPPDGEQSRYWPPLENDYSGYYAYFNRNKKGMVINLKTENGKRILRELIKKSDVLVENFKAGTFAKLGFSYEEIKSLNPQIIYAQITGFGLEGPMSKRPCYDIVAQAESGMMDMTGFPDGDPVKVGPSIADSFSGTFLALGVMMALFNRERTGQGCHLDVSMMDTMFSVMENYVVNYTLLGQHPTRMGNAVLDSLPWDLYHAKNGSFVIGVGTQRQWENFCKVLGLDDLINDERYCDFAVRAQHYYGDLQDKIEAATQARTIEDLEEAFVSASIPFGKVRKLEEFTNSELVKTRNMLWSIFDPGLKKELSMPGSPIKYQDGVDRIQKAAPLLGEDTDAVLREILAYTDEEIKEMHDSGAVE